MLRTFVVLGLLVLVGGAVIGLLFGLATAVLIFLVKVALLGAVVYLAVRIVSPRTAHRLREKIEQQSFLK